jgi:hypothetical protein
MTSIPVPHAGASPGTHALVIGVSDYPFADGPDASSLGKSFELHNLTTAARSASEVAAWLLNEYINPGVPLASLRVLLSPVPGESIHPDIAAHLNDPAPATRAVVEAELRQFRKDCRQNLQNAAFVYIAGHGIQLNKRGAVSYCMTSAIRSTSPNSKARSTWSAAMTAWKRTRSRRPRYGSAMPAGRTRL